MVQFIAVNYGWRAAFVVTGVISVVWLIAWLAVYRRPAEHPRLADADVTYAAMCLRRKR
ncbi:hypothetical protein [Novosphingobium sp. BL-52-GroH]|uniref:hypothetical protein n=1 Tax=Novosphingobium sp. BL-52-GroH TaxID=3349877 RepID=UPI00384E6505